MSYKVLGINDDVTTCECCGKAGLKKTVVLESETTGILHYGADCAAKALYGKKSSGNRKIVESYAKAIEYAKKWIGKAPLTNIYHRITVHFCPAHIVGESIIINGVTISA